VNLNKEGIQLSQKGQAPRFIGNASDPSKQKFQLCGVTQVRKVQTSVLILSLMIVLCCNGSEQVERHR
jgi:hypothetical protein